MVWLERRKGVHIAVLVKVSSIIQSQRELFLISCLDDCGTTVEQNIKCANTSWTYFPSPDNQPVGFCCLPDWVGYVQLNSSGDQLGVACETPGYVLDELQSTVPSIKLGSQSTSTTSSTVSTTPVTTSAQTTTEAVTTTSGGQTVAIPTETGIASSEASSNGSSGIGAGPIVGIVLGVIAVLSGLASFYYFWRKKRRAAAGLGPDDGTHGNAAMMAGYYEPVPETKQSTPYEMLATTPPVELDGGMRPELPTEWYGHEAGGTAKESQASRPAPL